jgi:hypothetical protein
MAQSALLILGEFNREAIYKCIAGFGKQQKYFTIKTSDRKTLIVITNSEFASLVLTQRVSILIFEDHWFINLSLILLLFLLFPVSETLSLENPTTCRRGKLELEKVSERQTEDLKYLC